jgi:hypothetical protein
LGWVPTYGGIILSCTMLYGRVEQNEVERKTREKFSKNEKE